MGCTEIQDADPDANKMTSNGSANEIYTIEFCRKCAHSTCIWYMFYDSDPKKEGSILFFTSARDRGKLLSVPHRRILANHNFLRHLHYIHPHHYHLHSATKGFVAYTITSLASDPVRFEPTYSRRSLPHNGAAVHESTSTYIRGQNALQNAFNIQARAIILFHLDGM